MDITPKPTPQAPHGGQVTESERDRERENQQGWNSVNVATPEGRKCPAWLRKGNIEVASRVHPVSPIQALNPYGSDWRVKAKVSRKTPKRSFSRNGEQSSVFSAYIVDENGTQAELVFWREQADKYYDSLEEGKVYLLSKFNVKPANKNFSALKYDYTLHVDKRSTIEECPDQDTSKMQEEMEITQVSDLGQYLGRQALVTVMGVVISCGAKGNVKRKSDNVELMRRDVSILDKSMKSVLVTVWGQLVDDAGVLEMENRRDEISVAVISGCRVTDFNGLSLNSTSGSTFAINPDTAEARSLKEWYETEGKTLKPVAIGEGLPSNRQGRAPLNRKMLGDVQPEVPPPADSKPEYSVVHATIVYINPDQSLVYLANLENQRKVVEQGVKYFCESDGQVYDEAEYRYVVNAKIADCSGECWITIFHDQAKEIFGVSAGDMALWKTSDPDLYRSVLSNAQWKPHVFRIASKSREDPRTQELRMRHSIVALHQFDWAKECNVILESFQNKS